MLALVKEESPTVPSPRTDPRARIAAILAAIRDLRISSGFLPREDYERAGLDQLSAIEREATLALVDLGERLEPSGRIC